MYDDEREPEPGEQAEAEGPTAGAGLPEPGQAERPPSDPAAPEEEQLESPLPVTAAANLPDYYAVLAVPPGSSRRTVAEAYDRLARELQPDENAPPIDPERMRAVDEAFDVLDDPARRAEYDRARGIEPVPEPAAPGRGSPWARGSLTPTGRRLDRMVLLAGALVLGGVGAVVAAGVILVGSLTGGGDCRSVSRDEVTTANGVTYQDLVVCDAPTIVPGDTVELNYVGRLEDGTEFANTYKDGQVLRFLYGQAALINGWDEGIAGMTVGSKRRVKIPADVYGEEAVDPNIIPSGSTLVFEVEIVGRRPGTGATLAPTPLVPTQQPVAAPDSPPEVAGQEVTTASGLKYIDIEAGTGEEARAGNTVVVNYTGWLQDGGKKFDSSLERSRPFDFVLGAGNVIAGWDEGVVGMKVGGKRRLIIPPELGYGANGAPPAIPPNATLIFDVELLDVQ